MREHEIANTTRIKVTSPLSHILSHSPEYRRLSGRKRREVRRAVDPAFFTLVDVAEELAVPLCALVPSIEHQAITDPQREVMTRYSRWVLGNFARHADERLAYTSDFEDFEAYVTIRKQAFASAAGPMGTDEQLQLEDVDILKSIPGIGEERFQVITVRGDSMADLLHPGNRVLVDVSRRTPRDGEIVAVDRGHLGRTIGYWRRSGTRCSLEKHNGATIELGPPDDWRILGTITRIVDAPLPRRERRKA